MDTNSNFKDIHFLDFSTLDDDVAKGLFDLIFPNFPYGKIEFPWREYSRIKTESCSPRKTSLDNTNNNNNDSTVLLQPVSVGQGSFHESSPVSTHQTYPSGPSLDLAPKAQVPPAPFLDSGAPRTMPHNISQFTQQPPQMTFYTRPPFPVASSSYPIPGQEMITLHHQQPPSFSDPALYDLQPENDTQAGMDMQPQHHLKYRNEKQTGYPMRKPKKPYYDYVYCPEEVMQTMMEGSVDNMNSQPPMTAPVVPFSNHFPGGISGHTGFPMQYISHSFVPFVPYPGYMQQPGALVDMTQAAPDVVAFEPPMMVTSHPHPTTATPAPTSRVPVSCVVATEHLPQPQADMEALPPPPPAEVVEPCEHQESEANDEKSWASDDAKEQDYKDFTPEVKTLETGLANSVDLSTEDNAAADVVEPDVTPVATSAIPEKLSEETTESVAPNSPDTAAPAKAEAAPVVLTSAAAVPPSTGAWGFGKSWAGLFKSEGVPVPDPKPVSVQEADNDHPVEEDAVCDLDEEDYLIPKLGKFVQRLSLDYTPRPFQPRGLINRSNWCYINATLQALLVCPAFYNLLRQLKEVVCQRYKSTTPIMDSLVALVGEFTPLNNVSKRKEDLSIAPPLEPVCIHKMLTLIKSECIKGRQEDAEEFLSCILNGLHEEMVSLTKAVTASLNNGTCNGDVQTNGRVDGSEEDEEEDPWKVIGVKNKGMVTRSDQVSGSLVKDLFGGQTRSVLTAGSECSAVLQPFFTLQLDIQNNGESVSESLSQLTVKEAIHGYQCPKSKREVEAWRRTTLEELPPVLILHFKRFVYDDKDGGSKKVLKKTDYPLDLELKTELLSPEVKKKYLAKQSRTYKLFAVVYHDGKEAVKGHYIADIFYPGSGSWLRCDDRNIVPTTEAQVLAFNSPCVPYLLFYSRTDLQQPDMLASK